MNITKLNKEHFEAFKSYMIKHRFEHDESYLYPEDIDEFEIGEDNPTYLLMENEQIIGCLSMMLTDYFRRGNKSRIRIFHCESTDFNHYQMLWNAIEPLGEGIKTVELFIPDKLQDTLKILNDP